MYKATKSFFGIVSMVRGEVRDLEPEIAKDLLKAGYVIDLGAKQKKAEEIKGEEPKTTKRAKNNV